MNDAYTIKAGETYAITLDHPVPPEQMETMRKHWEEATASKVIFLSGAKLVRTATDADEIIQRVRELHTWVTTTSVYDPDHKKICAECSQYHDCEEWGLTTGKSVLVQVEYPCPTIKALDGDQS